MRSFLQGRGIKVLKTSRHNVLDVAVLKTISQERIAPTILGSGFPIKAATCIVFSSLTNRIACSYALILTLHNP